MKKTNFILLISFFTAIAILSGCSQPASSQKKDPPLQPAAKDFANKIYQTNWDNSNPPSADRLEFSSDGNSAKYISVSDYSAEQNIEIVWENIKEAMKKANPKATFDDTKYYCFQEQDDFSPVSFTDLIEHGSFSADYSTYTSPATAEYPEQKFYRQ